MPGRLTGLVTSRSIQCDAHKPAGPVRPSQQPATNQAKPSLCSRTAPYHSAISVIRSSTHVAAGRPEVAAKPLRVRTGLSMQSFSALSSTPLRSVPIRLGAFTGCAASDGGHPIVRLSARQVDLGQLTPYAQELACAPARTHSPSTFIFRANARSVGRACMAACDGHRYRWHSQGARRC